VRQDHLWNYDGRMTTPMPSSWLARDLGCHAPKRSSVNGRLGSAADLRCQYRSRRGDASQAAAIGGEEMNLSGQAGERVIHD
jgi:hypothetical protein